MVPAGGGRRQPEVQGRARTAIRPNPHGRCCRSGSRAQAALLLARVFPELARGATARRRRARAGSRRCASDFLSWGSNERYAVTTSGRLQRVTDWVPLAKVQSIRLVEGPVQRRLRLSSIHLDTAGRRVHAVLRDRDATEARALLAELPDRCRDARQLQDGLRPARAAPSSDPRP